MMISKAQIQQVIKQYGDNLKVRKSEKTAGVSGTQRADEVSISQEALSAQQVQKYMQEIPDVRIKRVLELQERIQSGTYDVSGEDIAEKIFGRNIVDRIV